MAEPFAWKVLRYRVEVTPRSSGDFGSIIFGGDKTTPEESERACEEIAERIRRHVDGLPSRGASSSKGVLVAPEDVEYTCLECKEVQNRRTDTCLNCGFNGVTPIAKSGDLA